MQLVTLLYEQTVLYIFIYWLFEYKYHLLPSLYAMEITNNGFFFCSNYFKCIVNLEHKHKIMESKKNN